MAGSSSASAPDHDHLRDIRGDDQHGAKQHRNDYGRSEGLRMHLIPPLDKENDALAFGICRRFQPRSVAAAGVPAAVPRCS